MSDPEIAAVIYRELFDLKQKGKESGVSVHSLSCLPDVPTQRDQRVKEILAYLCDRGHVEQIQIDNKKGYRLTLEGERFWRAHGSTILLFYGMRRRISDRV